MNQQQQQPISISSASPEEDEEEMNIYLKITRTVALKVKKAETINTLKSLLQEKEGISEYLQELFYDGNHLKSGKTLVDYRVRKDSTLHLVQRTLVGQKIFVKAPSNQKTIEVEARTYDTIKNIKSIIQFKEGIQSDQYTLVYNGMVLEDDRTVASISSESQTTFLMVFNSKDILPISVKAPNGGIVKLKVKASFTVCDVKDLVGSMICHPVVTDCFLTYNGIQLEEGKVLAYYNIEEDSVLEMLPSWIQIFVKTWSCETITLDVHPCDTIEEIKGKILNKLKIPRAAQQNTLKHTSLVFAGKRLDDGQNLPSYNIQKHSTLLMNFR